MKYLLLFFAILTTKFSFAQNTIIPTDFKLIYTLDAGMYPLRENLVFDAEKGNYNAFEKGNEFKIKFNKKIIEQVHQELESMGFYTIVLPKKVDTPPRIAKDQEKISLSIKANGNSYSLTNEDIKKMDAKNAAIANKTFNYLNDFGKKYRK